MLENDGYRVEMVTKEQIRRRALALFSTVLTLINAVGTYGLYVKEGFQNTRFVTVGALGMILGAGLVGYQLYMGADEGIDVNFVHRRDSTDGSPPTLPPGD